MADKNFGKNSDDSRGSGRKEKGVRGLKKVVAVVCNYNKREYVAGCVQSVVESAFEGLDVVVVDNASTDGSAEWIRSQFGDSVKLFVNEENLGGERRL